MRHLLLLSVLLLGASWVAAQNNPGSSPGASSPTQASPSQTSPSQSPTTPSDTTPTQSPSSQTSPSSSGSDTTVEGCLSGSAGSYTLTDSSGNTIQLAGDTSKLAEHVGHDVKITGSPSSSSSSASSTSASGGTAKAGSSQQSMNVTGVQHVASTCQNSGKSK